MEKFIRSRIEDQADKSEEAGIEKYKAYFVHTRMWKKYRAKVNELLKEDGYENVIVTD